MIKKEIILAINAAIVLSTGCSLPDMCNEGQHTAENGACEPDSSEKCGLSIINCNEKPGWSTSECLQGACIAKSCEPNYILVGDNCEPCNKDEHSKNNQCIADSETSCGATDVNCTELWGWETGRCEAGVCIASACKYGAIIADNACQCPENTHQSADGCEMDSLEHCGAIDNACNLETGWSSAMCYQGKCAPEECSTYYELIGLKCLPECEMNEHRYGESCEENTEEHCGKHSTVCTEQTGWDGFSCRDGKCVPNGCAQGYRQVNGDCIENCKPGTHLHEGICEKNSAENCGSHGLACKKTKWADGQCVNAECVFTECADGYYKDTDSAGNADCKIDTCPEGTSTIVKNNQYFCGIPLETAQDLIQLRDALLKNDQSQAPGHPTDLAQTVYFVKKSIDLGEQPDWKGIGTKDMPFTGKFYGLNPDIKISGKLTCETDNCGLFGMVNSCEIEDLTLDISLTSSSASAGRLAGDIKLTTIKNVVVSGDMTCEGRNAGGVVGVAANSVFDNVVSQGTMMANSENANGIYDGGMVGVCRDMSFLNSHSSVHLYTEGDRVGGICGQATGSTFDNVEYIGVMRSRTSTDYPSLARIGGLVGQSGDNHILNSRVLIHMDGRDALGAYIGSNAVGGKTFIKNSLSISSIKGKAYVSGFVGHDYNYALNNVYSIGTIQGSSSKYNFCGQNSTSISLAHGYYDGDRTSSENEQCAKSAEQVSWTGNPERPVINDKELVDILNGNLSECNDIDKGQCHMWTLTELDLSNLIGDTIKVPWTEESVSARTDNAIKELEAAVSMMNQP